MATDIDFQQADARARERQAHTPRAISARYDRRLRRIVIELSTNLGIFFSPRRAEGLATATPDQLSDIEISPSGYGLHFPQLDADLYLPALLEGTFGSALWMAETMGAKGGRAKSPAKTLAAQANGRKGGRPKLLGAEHTG